MVEGHYHPQTSFFPDRVLNIGRVRSCCSYQGGDCDWAQQCVVYVLMLYHWLGGSGGSQLVGSIRSIINLEQKIG